jgi:hypothetical protein
LDIIYVDTPSGEVAKISSSYNLPIFYSRADPQRAESVEVAPEGSSPSIGVLWPQIDKLDEIQREDTSVVHTHEVAHHDRKSLASAKKIDKRSKRSGKGALLSDAPGPSNIMSKGCGKGLAKKNVAPILSTVPGAISPRMRRSFVDRQYSPLTGMEQSKWEIILE